MSEDPKDDSARSAPEVAPSAGNPLPPELDQRLDRLEHYLSLISEPIATRKDPRRTRWERFADTLETSVPSRIIIGLGALLTFFSLAGILATAWGVRLQYLSMEEEQVARAWQALATTGLGTGGKLKAIELIHAKGEDLSGINIGGQSRSTSSVLDTLKLDSAAIWDGNWNYTRLYNSSMNNVTFGRMQLQNAEISGAWTSTEVVWSDMTSAVLHLKRGSNVRLRTVIADNASIFFTAADEFTGVKLFAEGEPQDLAVNRHGDVIIGDDDVEKAARMSAGDMISFENVSLRCALMPIEYAVNAKFESSNVSGAYLGSPFYFEEEPESAIAKISEAEWAKFTGAWYFSDNPPKGVPADILARFFQTVDRERLTKQCAAHERRASDPNPLALLDGVDGIETACVSLARMPDRCETRYPSRSLFMLGSSQNEEFALPN